MTSGRDLEQGEIVVDGELQGADRNPASVIGYASVPAEEYRINEHGATVAELNPSYPATDDVVHIAFCADLYERVGKFWRVRDRELGLKAAEAGVTTYSYPRQRLTPGADIVELGHELCLECGCLDIEWRMDDDGGAIRVAECTRCGGTVTLETLGKIRGGEVRE